MSELVAVGGIQPLMKMLLKAGLLHGDCLTVTGKTMAQNLAKVKPYRKGQKIIQPLNKPIKKDSHLRILYGNLSPEGGVAKITGKEGLSFTGTARPYDSEEKAMKAILGGRIRKGDVIVIRYEGPKGGPGMREMLGPTGAIMGAGLGDDVVDHGRPFLRRHTRFCRWAHHAGSLLGRSIGTGEKRRLDHD